MSLKEGSEDPIPGVILEGLLYTSVRTVNRPSSWGQSQTNHPKLGK